MVPRCLFAAIPRANVVCTHGHQPRPTKAKAPQLRDEAATLQGLGLAEGSTLWVGEGRALQKGEVTLSLHLYQGGKFYKLYEMPLDPSKVSVGALKAEIATKLPSLEAHAKLLEGWHGGAALLRLRLKKGNEAGKLIVEGRSLRSVLGVQRSDAVALALQLLETPENVSSDDILVAVRFWRVLTKVIEPPVDIVLPKDASVGEVQRLLTQRFDLHGYVVPIEPEEDDDDESAGEAVQAGEEEVASSVKEAALPSAVPSSMPRLGLAKGFLHGPPLDHRGAIKLKWGDAKAVDRLRDGSLLVICDEQERAQAKARAQAAAKSKAKVGGAATTKKPRRNRRGGPAVSFAFPVGGSCSRVERSLKIEVKNPDGAPELNNASSVSSASALVGADGDLQPKP
eukprot:SAG11_NODE_283_length_11241_cov_8.234428_6_plen_397_part_00